MFQPEHPSRGAEKRTCVSFVPRRPVKTLILTPNINFLLPLTPLQILLVVAIKKLMAKERGEENSTGLVSSGASLTSWGEGASLALVGDPSSDGVTIKMPYLPRV